MAKEYEPLLMLCETDEQLIFLETLIERIGKKPVSRLEAKIIFKKSDSNTRQEITRMRKNGIPVISRNNSDGYGYLFPDSLKEYKSFHKSYIRQALTIIKVAEKMSTTAFNFFNGQGEIKDG